MNKLKFTVPGEPCAQGRPRFTTRGGYAQAVDPAKSRNQKAFIRYIATDAAKRQGWNYTDKALSVEITAVLSVPKSKPKKWKKAALEGGVRPTKKPDCDNIFKLITDAMSGVIYADDKQIVSCSVRKVYGEEPYTEVQIKEMLTNE
ncbi:MAG: RusA family crossover junction endodeoxyribonuclease [Phascolarctobacterium sp.]|nr:MAG: RusA family crossover junction endodeoxyribonuclease [Phascolarctobacterium sp.]